MKNSASTLKQKFSEPTNLVGANSPVELLYLYIFNQAIMDITSYYSGLGTLEARRSGREAIKWIRNCEGTFPVIATIASDIIPDLSVEGFHKWCLQLIYEIKQSCMKKKINRIRVIGKL